MYLSSKSRLIKFWPKVALSPLHFTHDTIVAPAFLTLLLREAPGSHLCYLVYITIPGKQGLRFCYLYLERGNSKRSTNTKLQPAEQFQGHFRLGQSRSSH